MADDNLTTCAYRRSDGTTCPGAVEEAGDGEMCFWHDPEASKEGPDVKQRLEEWAHGGEPMEGFVLRYANLQGSSSSTRGDMS